MKGSRASSVRFVESSLILAALLEGDREGKQALASGRSMVVSALSLAEARRVVARREQTGELSAGRAIELMEDLRILELRCVVIPIGEAILSRVGQAFPVEPVRTLDAIHLATLLALGEAPETVAVLTRDRRIRANAGALGFEVI